MPFDENYVPKKPDDEAIPPESMFHSQNVQQALLLTNLRIYDMLCVIAEGTNKEVYERIEEIHNAGRLFADPPYLAD